jgi:predicted transcriptional regulator YdeE
MGSKLVNYTVQSFPKMMLIGKGVRVRMEVGLNDRTITDLWESMTQDGSLALLLALPARLAQDPDTVGWMGDFQPGDEEYTYLAGVLVKPGTTVLEGFVAREIPECDMAVGWIQETDDAEGGDMHANAFELMAIAAKEHGYEFDASHGFFEFEYYSYERFRGPEAHGGKIILDYYSPCKKVS